MSLPRALFEEVFVHAFEEDGPEGAVYRADGHDVKRSRRPRERLSFGEDGSVRMMAGAPDDRLRESVGRWTEASGEIQVTIDPTIDAPGAVSGFRVRILPGSRLLVR